MNEVFSFSFALSLLPKLLAGAWTTIWICFTAFAIACVLGLPLALVRASGNKLLSWTARGIIEFVRSTPLLVQLFVVYFGLPKVGLAMTPILAGVLTLGFHYACYFAEVYRGGFMAVPPTQREAAWALSLSPFWCFKVVVLPQALPPIVPLFGTYLIGMFKDAALLASISVFELLTVARLIGTKTFRYTEPLTMAALLLLLMSLVAAIATRAIERHLANR